VWPTRSLVGSSGGSTELYVWTADFEPDRSLRSQIQLAAMEHAFSMLEHERVERIAVTISFGSIERSLESLAKTLEAHRLTAAPAVGAAARRHGAAALAVPGARVHRPDAQLPDRGRVPLRRAPGQHGNVRHRLRRPDFAKMLAPISVREKPGRRCPARSTRSA